MKYLVLLFYKYVEIFDLQKEFEIQNEFLLNRNLKGRIILANEGINGTLCGLENECEKYISLMKNNENFFDIDFKKSYSNFICFNKLKIKIKNEIVNYGDISRNISFKESQKKISPENFHKIILENKKNKNENLLIFDARNDYESRIGRFENAIFPNIKTSREIENYFDENKNTFLNKDVIMYCTGGVRCEKISAILYKKKIAKSIKHLDGGIYRYIEKYENGFFKGKNYVFDDRISQRVTNDILTNCDICKIECDDYNNCLNAICNKHYICCNFCYKQLNGNCSDSCKILTESKKVPLRPSLPSRVLDFK